MNIRKFISTYKCRLCGETFQSVGTPNINNAYAEVFDIAMYHSGVRKISIHALREEGDG